MVGVISYLLVEARFFSFFFFCVLYFDFVFLVLVFGFWFLVVDIGIGGGF